MGIVSRIKRLIKRESSLLMSNILIRDGCLIMKIGNEDYIGKKVLRVSSIALALSELRPNEVTYILKTYYNTLNLGFPVEIRTYVKPISIEDYVKKLDRSIENLQVVTELNPSSYLKTKLLRLTSIKKKVIEEGLTPYDVTAYFIVEARGNSVDAVVDMLNYRAKILRNALNSIGVRVRDVQLRCEADVMKIFFQLLSRSLLLPLSGKFNLRIIGYELFILTPFLIYPLMPVYLRCEGLYLGTNADSGEKVFWNFNRSLSPHIVVLGPTGSGKTEFLSMVSSRLAELDVKVIVYDVKGEYSERLSKWGCGFRELVLGKDVGLGIDKLLSYVPKKLRPLLFMDILMPILKVDELSKELMSVLYRALTEVFLSNNVLSNNITELIIDYLVDLEDQYLSYRLSRVLRILDELSSGEALADVLLGFSSGHVYILNTSYVLSLGLEYLSLVSNVLLKTLEVILSRVIRPKAIPRVSMALILDEGWVPLRCGSLVNEVIRLGRSYGLLTAIASQRACDIASVDPAILSNAGLFAAMPSPDLDYWREVSRYVLLSNELIRRLVTTLAIGEALVRIAPNPRPIILKFSDFITT